MKVLWVFNHPAPYKVDFFNELGKKCDLTVLFERGNEGDRNPAFYYEKAKSFHPVFLNALKLGKYNSLTNKIVKEIKKTKYDAIVMNGYSTFGEMKALGYLHKKKIPYIFAINGGIVRENESNLRRYLKRKYISGATLYLAPDKHSGEYLKFYGADEKKIVLYPYSTVFASEVLPNPPTHDQQLSFRKKEGLPGERLFISVGQFISRKNNLELLKLWKKMDPKDTLLLVGDGPEKEQYLNFIAENKMVNVVIRDYEPHTKILNLFKLADFSIFLTKEDIYGHVVNESLSQGTPVIASTKANSALNLIENGVNGFLVDLDKPEEILKTLQQPTNELLRLGALETAQNNTIEKMADRHYEILEGFVKQ
jgi:glycosyltransferase involved in cell wall biosynthesis